MTQIEQIEKIERLTKIKADIKKIKIEKCNNNNNDLEALNNKREWYLRKISKISLLIDIMINDIEKAKLDK